MCIPFSLSAKSAGCGMTIFEMRSECRCVGVVITGYESEASV